MLNSTVFLMGEGAMDDAVTEAQAQPQRSGAQGQLLEAVDFLTTNIFAVTILSYGTWTALGILWYSYYNHFTSATAFYYAMDAGLSIGFCNPSEKDDWSKLFTIFYVLAGSSVVSGAIGVFAASLLSSKVVLYEQFPHGIGAVPLRDQAGHMTPSSLAACIWYHIKYLSGWYSRRSFVMIWLLWVCWISWGSVYAALYEEMSTISAVYWAVTTLSTGGLQTPPCLGDTVNDICDMGTFRGTVMGIYMMFGVPIYAATLAQTSRYVVGWLLVQRQEELLQIPIEDQEFLFAANVLSAEGSETLVLGEYILLELMRLGLTNQRQIEEIKRRFHGLDAEQMGELDLQQLRQTGKVVASKKHVVERRRSTNTNAAVDVTEFIESFSKKHALRRGSTVTAVRTTASVTDSSKARRHSVAGSSAGSNDSHEADHEGMGYTPEKLQFDEEDEEGGDVDDSYLQEKSRWNRRRDKMLLGMEEGHAEDEDHDRSSSDEGGKLDI